MAEDSKADSVRDRPFKLSVEQRGDATVLHVSGSCTMSVSNQLGERLMSLASKSQQMIVVEMSGLDFIESMGLGGIVAGYLRSKRYQGGFRLAAPQPSIRHLLELTRLTQLFPVYETLDQALTADPKR